MALLLLGFVAFLALVPGLGPVVHADNGSGNWRHLSTDTEPDLLSPDVHALAFERDAEGIPMLWIGTDRGLQSFDGRDWETFPQEDIADRDVWALACDDKGNLWVGTSAGLIQRDAEGNWHAWPTHDDGPLGTIHVIEPLVDGRVLVATDGVPSFGFWDPDSEKWSLQDPNLDTAHDILVTDDAIWLATEGGAVRLDSPALSQQAGPTIQPSKAGLSDDVRALALQDDGKLWIGTGDGLVGVPVGGQDAPETWDLFRPGQPGLANYTVNDLLLDHDGDLWVATDGGGLSRYDPALNRWTRYFHDRDGLLSDRVRQLLLDDQGTLWAATDAGVSGLDHTWHSFTPATTAPTDFIGANDAQALWGDGDGTVWTGTDGGGVSFTPDDGATWTTLTSANSDLPDDRILSLWGDDQGTVWIGTGRGLVRWSGDETSWTLTRAHPSLPTEPIHALWGNSAGTVWIGAQSGLFYSVEEGDDPARPLWMPYSGEREALTFTLSEEQSSRAPIVGTVQALWGDGTRVLWVGTSEGLFRISGNPADATWAQFTTANGLPDNDIQTIWGDPGGRPWIGTHHGLGRPAPSDGDSWVPVTVNNTDGALPSDSISALWIDERGQVWAGTKKGLVVSSDAETWETRRARVVTAVWGDRRGHLWAGGPNKIDHRPGWEANWQDYVADDRGLRSPLIFSLLHDPSTGTLWATTPAGLASSRDGGLTWNTNTIPWLRGSTTIHRTDQGTLWVSGSAGVARSQDGTTWKFLKPPEAEQINALWVGGGQQGSTVWLGTNRGLHRSDDGGTNWQPQPIPNRLKGQGVRAVTGHGGTLWIGTQNGLLAYTQDGRSWRVVDDLTGETIHDLWTQGDRIMAATERGLRRSDDGGNRWELFSADEGLPDDVVTAIYVVSDSKEIWLGTENGGLAHTSDDGDTWHVLDTGDGLPHNHIYAITSSFEPDGTMWAATAYGLTRYAPRPEVRPWVRLLQVSDGQEIFNLPGNEVRLTSDLQLDIQFIGGSLIARPETVRYDATLTSKDDASLSFPPQSRNPAGADSVASVPFAAGEAERLDGDYTLSIIAIDQDGRTSAPRTLTVIAPATTLEKVFKWLRTAVLTFIRSFLLITVLAVLAGWGVLWSLARSIGMPRRVLLRQGARIPIVSLGYRSYRHRWKAATPLERLLTLLTPHDRSFNQAEAADWLQDRAIPCEEETLERTLEAAVRDDLLRREGDQYSLAEKALNRALQDHEGFAGREALMRQVRDTHPLVAEAHSLFTAAGFALEDVDEPLSFLCQPVISFWTRRFEESIYTRVLPGASLDGDAVRALHRDASAAPEAGPVAFVVMDTHPDDSGWDVIGELRAAGFTIVPIDDNLIQSWQVERREQHNLAEHLDRFLDPDYDPYVTLTAASGALGYFGHRELAQRLLKRLEQGQATALIGLRKMGTSSTLRYLQDQARWPTALVDLQAGLDLSTILASAIQDWGRSAQRKLALNLTPPERLELTTPVPVNETGDPVTDFMTTVTHFAQQLRASTGEPSARLIFLLDEIELLVSKPDASGPNLARYLTLTRLLKGLIQDGLLSLMVAGSDLQFNRISLWGEHANPLYQLFQEQFLPPLSPDECGHMVRNLGRQVGLTYDQETLDFIAQASGGHPYLARQLCSLAYQALGRAGPVPLDVVRQAAERFVRDPRTAAFLDDNGLWGYLGQPDLWGLMRGRANQAVLIDLAAALQPLTAHELKEGPNPEARAGAIYALRESWVIRPAEPVTSPPAYEISFGLFRDWIAFNRDKESPKLQLQQNAQEFLANSGFSVKLLESKGYTPWDFLSVPQGAGWRARFDHPIYTAIVARQVLDDQAVLSVREAALTHSPGSGVAFVIIDERPDDTAWLQIATLRARGFSLILLTQTLLQDGRASQKERRLLHNHLDRTLGRGHNPYDVRSPVYDVLNFFGRQALADQMVARLTAAQPLALFGLRKMGKSSVLYYLRNHAPFPVALVDLQSETELRAIYHEILRGWSRSLYIKFDFEWPVPALPETDRVRDLPAIFRDITTDLLETLAQLTPQPKLGIFLDEIEQIVPHPNEFDLKLHQYLAFMRGLRGIIQESKQLALLVAGVDPAINRISRYGNEQNPSYQLFQEIFLSPLTPEDCGQMVRNIGRQVGLRFPQTAVDVINEASGGHPFLARQLCSRVYNELERAGQITAPLLHETVDTFIHNPQTAANLDENGMWGEVTQPTLWEPEIAEANQQLLKQLAAAVTPLNREEILKEDGNETLEDAFFALQNRWVISKVKRKRGLTVYQITFGLFRRWIRRHFGLETHQPSAVRGQRSAEPES